MPRAVDHFHVEEALETGTADAILMLKASNSRTSTEELDVDGRSTNPRDYVLGKETFECKGGHVGETERGFLTTDQKVVRAAQAAANLETQLQKVHSAGSGIRMNSAFVVSC